MAVERVIIEISGDTTKIKSTITELEKLGKVDRVNADSFKKTNEQMRSEMNKTRNSIGGLENQFNDLKNAIVGAFAVQSLISFGKEAIQTAAKMDSIGKSLEFITGSAKNAQATIEFLKNLSNRLGLEFTSAAQAFKLFAGATTQSGMSLNQTKTIFEQVSRAVTTMGLSADDANGVFLALSQVMSKGTVQAEELRGQIGERIPGAFTIAAKSIGVSEQALNKMLEQGQVISKDFLPKFAKQLEKDMGGGAEAAANSTQAALNRLSNTWSDFKDWFGSTIVAPIVKGAADVVTAMKSVSPHAKASAMAQADLDSEYAKFEKTINDLEFAELKYIKAQELILQAKDNEKKALKDQKVAYVELGNYMSTYYSDRERAIFQNIRNTQGEDAFLTRLIVTGDKRVRNLVQEIRLNGEYAKGYEDLIPKMEAYQQSLNQENTVTDEVVKTKEKKTKAVEKELNEYEALTKAASDLEAQMRDSLVQSGIVSPKAIAQLDDFKKQIELVEIAMRNLNNPELRNISGGGQLTTNQLGEAASLQTGDFGDSAYNAEVDALMGLHDLYKDDAAAFAESQQEKNDILSDNLEKRKFLEQQYAYAAMQLVSMGVDFAYAAKQSEYDYELQLLKASYDNKKISDDEYNKRYKEIQRERAESEKEAAIFKATIDTANAVVNALATGGVAAPELAFLAGILGAAQIALIAATPLPRYAEGTDFVKRGKNPVGTDTIPAMLNEGEAIIKTNENLKYPGLSKAWNEGKLENYVYERFMLPTIMAKSMNEAKEKSFAENIAKSIVLNQDMFGVESKLTRIEQVEKLVGNEIVKAIKETNRKNVF